MSSSNSAGVKLVSREIFIALVVAIVVVFLLQPYADWFWRRPDVTVVGVQPLILYEEGKLGDVEFRQHWLALILKVQNESAAPTSISAVVLEGCVGVDPLVADTGLTREGRIQDGENLVAAAAKRSRAVQKIRAAAIFRDDAPPPTIGGHET